MNLLHAWENIPKHHHIFWAAFLGGLTSSVTLQPFDLLKTRIQQNRNTTLLNAIRSIDSPIQLWRGTLPSALRTSFGSALYLSTLNIFRSTIAKRKVSNGGRTNSSYLPQLTMYENLFSGAISRAIVGLITMPITIIKVRFESTMYAYRSMSEATAHIYRAEGIRGFFSGSGATILRDAPYAGIYVLLYEQSKQQLPKFLPSSMIAFDEKGMYTTYTSTIVNSIGAFSSASLATAITSPFDTIKTRMQLNPSKFSGFIKTLYLILKEEKPRNLFDGLSLRLTRKALSAGIAWGYTRN